MAKRGRSLGSVLFQRAEPRSQREKARKCLVDESTVSRWISGETKPNDWQTRTIVERATGVPAPLWDKPYSAADLAKALKDHPHLAGVQVMQGG